MKGEYLWQEEIQQAFMKAYNQMLNNKRNVIQDCLLMKSVVSDTTELDKQLEAQKKEVEMITDHVNLLIQSNASNTINQDEYLTKYNALKERYDAEIKKYKEIEVEITSKQNKAKAIDNFIENLKKNEEVLNEWDMFTWNIMVETAVINLDKTITFKFYGGFETTI